MKVTPEHLTLIREAVEPLDTDERRARYRNREFPRAALVQDLNKRYRWDLLLFATSTQHWPEPTLRISTLYDAGYADRHIDTALKAVVPAL